MTPLPMVPETEEGHTLLALADLCEAATGPSREIDRAIMVEVGAGSWLQQEYKPWPYTASLDAAMTLVPEGALASVQVGSEGLAWVSWRASGSTGSQDWTQNRIATTGPLALCAAALRARASRQEQQKGGAL